jgi:hypothetical protein
MFIFTLKLFQSCWFNVHEKKGKVMAISADNGNESVNGEAIGIFF